MEISKLYDLFLQSTGVSTDTRTIGKDSMFFALKGANFDGNLYASKALEAGAKYAIVDNKDIANQAHIIVVDDVLQSLQQLAMYHRLTFDIPFIAITGSNGKTTTKELVNVVLQQKYKTYATIGNLNNHIGIPLTLLAITKDVEIAIIEMGANHQKEIEGYCKYTQPTHGLITNIGKAHLEGFGGLEGVKKGKGELYAYLIEHDRQAFVCSTNTTLMEMQQFANPILYPKIDDFYACRLLEADPYISLEAENKDIINTNLAGAYNFDNIAAALCIGKYFEVDQSKANNAIRNYNPDNNRSQIQVTAKNKIVIDCYNANPTSMKAAIESFAQTHEANKVLIIGDMYELGDEAKQEHRAIGELINALNFSAIYLCGKEMVHSKNVLGEKAHYFANRDELYEYLQLHPIADTTILLKGSRGMALEKLMVVL